MKITKDILKQKNIKPANLKQMVIDELIIQGNFNFEETLEKQILTHYNYLEAYLLEQNIIAKVEGDYYFTRDIMEALGKKYAWWS